MKKPLLMAFISLMFSTSLWAKPFDIPENDWLIAPLRIKSLDVVTEEDFILVTQTLHKLYTPVIFEKSLLKFVINVIALQCFFLHIE